jgi:hypothetical protein
MAKLLKTNEITLHIMEDEVNYLSTISYINGKYNVTHAPSHLYNTQSGVSMTLMGGGYRSSVKEK